MVKYINMKPDTISLDLLINELNCIHEDIELLPNEKEKLITNLLDKIDGVPKEKIDSLARIIDNAESNIVVIDNEIERLNNKKQRVLLFVKKVKAYLSKFMISKKITRTFGTYHSVFLKEELELDEKHLKLSRIDDTYFKIVKQLQRGKLMDDINKYGSVKGVPVVKVYKILIK